MTSSSKVPPGQRRSKIRPADSARPSSPSKSRASESRGHRFAEDLLRDTYRITTDPPPDSALTRPEPLPFTVVSAERSPEEIRRIKSLSDPMTIIGDGRVDAGSFGITQGSDGPEPTRLVSSVPTSLYLTNVTLNELISPGLAGINHLYVLGVAWDLSGKEPRIYLPLDIAKKAPPEILRSSFSLGANETAQFIGDGIQLWPEQPIYGGLFVYLVIMKSDAKSRELGEKLGKVREGLDKAKKDDLATVLGTVVNGISSGVIAAAQQIALVLSGVIQGFLKENKDDVVAVFQGTYGAENIAKRRTDILDQARVSITLDLRPSKKAAESKRPALVGRSVN